MSAEVEIFTDGWRYGAMPAVTEGQPIDYEHLAAMGSCFARNMNRWLQFHGYTQRKMPWDILYNPFSIQKELERIYNPVVATQATDAILHEVTKEGEERFRDPWRTWHTAETRDGVVALNEAFDQRIADFLSTTKGFLITFGLAEVWSSLDDPGLVLNQVPIGSLRRGEQNWTSRFASVGEVHHALGKTTDIIREHITSEGPVVFTLSPVPLRYTASGLGIREANSRSKSVLAVALGEFVAERADVEYYPSYEMVQALSEQPDNQVWQADGRHVSARVVDRIARTFMAAHGRPVTGETDNTFWVPRVNETGQIVGKLYVDHSKE